MDEIRISHVEKSYTTLSTDLVIGGAKRPSRTRKVLQDVNLTFPAGKLSVLVGRSGCGKSTLLKLLAGKEAPDAGEITLPEGWHTALLSPEPYVITWTNVRQNVAMASGVGRTPEERYEHAMEYVKLVGLEDYADLSPVELSTGMKQRLGLSAGAGEPGGGFTHGRAVCVSGFSHARGAAASGPAAAAEAAAHDSSCHAPAGRSAAARAVDHRHASAGKDRNL